MIHRWRDVLREIGGARLHRLAIGFLGVWIPTRPTSGSDHILVMNQGDSTAWPSPNHLE